MIYCYQCQKTIERKTPVGPAEQCPHCGADLHCCFNCRYYSPTAINQCLVPDIPPVKDKKAANACAKFQLREVHRTDQGTTSERAKKKWDDLFKL